MFSQEPSLTDQFGRRVNYLRLSITDRCNLRCFYCRTCKEYKYIPHDKILRYEEFLDLIRLSDDLGVCKVRLTGGEPFVRKDFIKFLGYIHNEKPDLDLRVTTNGTLITGKTRQLFDVGLSKINISLDTLNRVKYEQITGRDLYNHVRQGIDECLDQGIKVKLNIVSMRGINSQEVLNFVRFAYFYPVDIRFIEFMPIGSGSNWNDKYFISSNEIKEKIDKEVDLRPLRTEKETSGPAQMYKIEDGLGRVGFISPLSNHFCHKCNRFRITPQGNLRTCLFSDREYRLRPLLRSSKLSLNKVLKVMQLANARKPFGNCLLQEKQKNNYVCKSKMSSIGG